MSASSIELGMPPARTAAAAPGQPEPTTAFAPGGQPEPLTLHALVGGVRAHLFADRRRTVQTWLGLFWLLDGGLQFQSFMYGHGFIASLQASAAGQPQWIAASVNWAASTMQSQQTLFNTLFALVQIAIGLGLLHRRTARAALALSFVWAMSVWWFGEGFSMVFMAMASPLFGAPGAAILYLLVGLVVWPSERPGGLLGTQGVRLMWAALWLVMAWLWLTPAGSSPNVVSETINGAPSGLGWLAHLQTWAATATAGGGVAIGLALALASAAIGLAVARDWHAHAFLGLSIALNLVFWVLGQGFGGIFAGGATDPNSAPLLMLLACALYPLTARSPARAGRSARLPASA